jgi:hypothetical protein
MVEQYGGKIPELIGGTSTESQFEDGPVLSMIHLLQHNLIPQEKIPPELSYPMLE